MLFCHLWFKPLLQLWVRFMCHSTSYKLEEKPLLPFAQFGHQLLIIQAFKGWTVWSSWTHQLASLPSSRPVHGCLKWQLETDAPTSTQPLQPARAVSTQLLYWPSGESYLWVNTTRKRYSSLFTLCVTNIWITSPLTLLNKHGHTGLQYFLMFDSFNSHGLTSSLKAPRLLVLQNYGLCNCWLGSTTPWSKSYFLSSLALVSFEKA